MKDHQSCSKLVLSEISKEAIDKSTRVVNQVGPSIRLVDRTGTFGQSQPS